MPTAPQITGQVLLERLTSRLLTVYDQSLECVVTDIEFRSAQRLVVAMALKVGREFSELVRMLRHDDVFLDLWVDFEDDLKNMIALSQGQLELGKQELVTRMKDVLLSFARVVKKYYGVQHAAVISAKMKEYESRRMAAGSR